MIFLILFCFLFLVTYTKTEIAQWYNVTRPTFRKWIQYLSSRTDYEAWKRKRKFSGLEALSLIGELGWPDSGACLTKGQIKEQCETEYRIIADNVKLNVAKLGIDVSAYQRVDIFPPLVSQRIIAVLG
jgi:hypothetical protein